MANILQNLSFKVSNIEVPPSKMVISPQPYQPEYDPSCSPVPMLIRFPFPVLHLKLAQFRRQVHQCNCNHLVEGWMENQHSSITFLPISKYTTWSSNKPSIAYKEMLKPLVPTEDKGWCRDCHSQMSKTSEPGFHVVGNRALFQVKGIPTIF